MASLVQPALTLSQLSGCSARFIAGTGAMGQFALSQLSAPLRTQAIFIQNAGPPRFEGRPVIDMRTFCAIALPAEIVIYATRDSQLMYALVATGQTRILDIRALFESTVYRQQLSPTSKLASISTVPRSGSYRLRYFFYALNELLKGSPAPSAHKLYLYHLSLWAKPESRYNLTPVYQFLHVDGIRFGHFMPPGALVALSSNAAVTSRFDHRAAAFTRACERHPALAATSFPLREFNFEPRLETGSGSQTRFALLARDIIDQLTSMISIFELSAIRLRRRRREPWTLSEIATMSIGRFRPFVLHLLDGLMPIVLERALTCDETVVDVLIDGGYLDSLITDYALQTYACEWFEAEPNPNVCAKQFSYAEMMSDDRVFFPRFIEFLRGEPIAKAELDCVEAARCHTSRAAMLQMEHALGHSISHNEHILDVFDADSHLTSSENGGFRALRSAVAATIHHHEVQIRGQLAAILKEFRNARPIAASAS